jgi:3-oxoacyl-[acyl-carrier protein] reductase
MDLELKGKTAMIAASSMGIGKAIALALAKENVNVSLCARNEARLKETSVEIRKNTLAEVIYTKADLSDPKDIHKFASNTIDKFAKVDILVTNSGGPILKYFGELDEGEWDYGIKLTLLSTVNLIREVLPLMKERRWGRIINMTSISAKQPLDKFTLSNTLRSGILGLTKSLSNELAPFNVLVNTICPGFTKTQRMVDVFEKTAERKRISIEEAMKDLENSIPLARMARPEDIADLAVLLCSERASYLTGAAIQIDGGFTKGII